MPSSFNLNDSETAYVLARPEERKKIAVGQEGASIRHERDGKEDAKYEDLDPGKPVEIDHPVTLMGPGHFSIEGLDTEVGAPALKADVDSVQEPSAAAKSDTKRNRKESK